MQQNPWREKGVPTALALGRGGGTRIPYIMGVAPLVDGFDSVRAIRRTATGIRLAAAGGACIDHAVDTKVIH